MGDPYEDPLGAIESRLERAQLEGKKALAKHNERARIERLVNSAIENPNVDELIELAEALKPKRLEFWLEIRRLTLKRMLLALEIPPDIYALQSFAAIQMLEAACGNDRAQLQQLLSRRSESPLLRGIPLEFENVLKHRYFWLDGATIPSTPHLKRGEFVAALKGKIPRMSASNVSKLLRTRDLIVTEEIGSYAQYWLECRATQLDVLEHVRNYLRENE